MKSAVIDFAGGALILAAAAGLFATVTPAAAGLERRPTLAFPELDTPPEAEPCSAGCPTVRLDQPGSGGTASGMQAGPAGTSSSSGGTSSGGSSSGGTSSGGSSSGGSSSGGSSSGGSSSGGSSGGLGGAVGGAVGGIGGAVGGALGGENDSPEGGDSATGD